MPKASDIQEKYYTNTADSCNTIQNAGSQDSDHDLALLFLSSMIDSQGIRSILDVRTGIGRTISFISQKHPAVKIIGIEPVEALRIKGYEKGINKDQLIDGDGNNLQCKAGEFDLVCEFGILHHVAKPAQVVSEMLRVANKGIFISDSNNFGNGSAITRLFKQTINLFGLWPTFNYIKTNGKGYQISDGDGLYYSYSVFNIYGQVKKICKRVHFFNTRDSGVNLYRSTSHIALL